MWCTSCQSDVAAEVSTDSKRVHCAICGNDLGTTSAARISDKTKEARELLARWSNRDILDPYGPLTKSESRSQPSTSLFERPETPQAAPVSQAAPPPRSEQKQEAPPAASMLPHVETEEHTYSTYDAETEYETSQEPDAVPYLPPTLRSEFRDIQDLIEDDDQSPNWLGLVGQLMAYGGVAVLTIGTTLVLWGYFGGPTNYTSTGWLISTAGQMLLFLGVITLVSAGMEQTSQSVNRRIDRLGKRIFLFEQAMLEQRESHKQRRAASPSVSRETAAPEPTARKSA